MKHLVKKQTRALALGSSALCMMASVASADIQHLDDVIITFSLCVGNDCANGESFGFDTVRLKENNLRLHFDDTSVSASFPRNDWRIVANDTGNGGASYLAIEDSTAGRIPFRVEAGAPVNTLYVEADGDVGIKTANPVVDLHVVEGNTPTLRLEQDGSDGFAPQTWDIAGNEANFFVRDVTNGSQLAFRIDPGADESALHIKADNDIGMGTSAPADALHIKRSSGAVAIRLESGAATYPARINLNPNNDEVRITFDGAPGGSAFKLNSAGNLTLAGSLTTTGSCSVGCDRVFDETYPLPSIEEHASLMWENSYLPAVGATPEQGQYELTSKMFGMLNELEKAHIYIEQLHERLSLLEEQQVSPVAQ